MAMISIRLTSEEEKLFKEFAKSKDVNLSALIRQTLTEKIEDEYDMKIYQEYLANKEYKEARPLKAIIEELELTDGL